MGKKSKAGTYLEIPFETQKMEIPESVNNDAKQKMLNRILKPISKSFDNSFQLALFILSVIPINFEIYEFYLDESTDLKNMSPEQLKAIETLKKQISKESSELPLMGAYASLNAKERQFTINLALYKNAKDGLSAGAYLEDIMKYKSSSLAFVYMHECLHIFNRDLENQEYYVRACHELNVTYHGEDVPQDHAYATVNCALDYHINSTIVERVGMDGMLNGCLYDKNMSSKDMNQIQILDKLIKETTINRIDGKGFSIMQITDANGNTKSIIMVDAAQGKGDGSSHNKENGSGQNADGSPSDGECGQNWNKSAPSKGEMDSSLSDVIREALNDVAQKLRGAGTAEMLSKLGIPISIQLDWAKKLTTKLDNICYQKTDKYDLSWAKPNLYTRHIATMPGSYYLDGKPVIYIMIDSSGSMGDTELRKINYVIYQLNKKGFTIVAIVHDWTVVSVNKFAPNSPRASEFVQYRYAAGGTSHKDAFEYIENELDTERKRQKAVAIIASDMYSDIESICDNYVWTKKVKTICLSTTAAIECPFGETIHVPGGRPHD